MDQEGTAAELPLELRCEAIAPWLWRVSWAAGGAVASDAEREQIAQVAASRANGALVVLAPAGTDEPLIPSALTPIVGTIHRGFSSPDLTRHERTGEPGVFFAPRGRGRVVMASRSPTEAATRRLVESLATKEATAAALERIELMLAAASDAAHALAPGLPSVRPSLDDGELAPASGDRDALARFVYVADGDGRFLESALDPGGALVHVARLCRGGESFTLHPRLGGRPLERAPLVLARATAAADRGALLRVFLDDEDLGPWRLGDAQAAERTSFDLFRISSDLLAGREALRLTFRLEGRREIAALRWWFLHEEEPDGTWLTELEASAAEGGGAPRADRAADGGLLVHDDELFLRGLELAPGARVRYALPRGERRLALTLARGDAEPEDAARLAIAAKGASTRIELEAQARARREVALPLPSAAAELLELANEGEAPLRLLAPRLLR
jgi:hypothetical protein